MEPKKPLIYSITIRLLGLVFCLSGVLKMINPESFQTQILAYEIFDFKTSFLIAHYLPPFEFVLGCGMVFRCSEVVPLFVSVGLLLSFSALLIWSLFAGIALNCGCFGALSLASSPPAALGRNILLLLLAFYNLKIAMALNRVRN